MGLDAASAAALMRGAQHMLPLASLGLGDRGLALEQALRDPHARVSSCAWLRWGHSMRFHVTGRRWVQILLTFNCFQPRQHIMSNVVSCTRRRSGPAA